MTYPHIVTNNRIAFIRPFWFTTQLIIATILNQGGYYIESIPEIIHFL
jgi:hypothetical protein